MSFTHQGRTIRKVAVIGSGQIGPDIALYFTKVLSPFGVQTVVVDVSEDALQKGKGKLEKKVQKGVESGAFTAEQQAQMIGAVSFTSDYAQVSGADLVVEAATENKELKGKIFGQVEGLVAADAILVSNSSHLEPEVIFANAKNKGRTGVVHYFFPAERNLLVEVVSGKDTAPATRQWLLSFYEAIGKVPIPVKSRYGYALDPVFEGLFFACALLAEEGVASTKQIDVICKKTFQMGIGSFTAMNLTGGNPITAVGLDNYTTKINSFFRTPQSLKDKVSKKENWDVPARRTGRRPRTRRGEGARRVARCLLRHLRRDRRRGPRDGRRLQPGPRARARHEAGVHVHERDRHEEGTRTRAGLQQEARGLPGAQVHRGARHRERAVRGAGRPA
jgi:enoyl-CoA hydratase/3-hydroxyacyl-CoA dehydrogenase